MDYKLMEPTDKKFLFYLIDHPKEPAQNYPSKFGNDVRYSIDRLLNEKYIVCRQGPNGVYYDVTALGCHIIKNFMILDDEQKKLLDHNWKVAIISAIVGAISGGVAGFLASLLANIINGQVK